MLNGVGGRTIAEAKANLSAAEAMQWSEYRDQRGSLNSGWRLERAISRLQLFTLRQAGDKHMGFDDLFPFDKPFEVAKSVVAARRKPTAKELADFLQAGSLKR